MKRRVPMMILALLPMAFPALAAGPAPQKPVVVNGMTFSSWTDYFTSDYFRANGLRCGTPDPVAHRKGGRQLDIGPEDCGLDLTNPSDDYAPNTLFEITVVIHRLESLTGDGVFDDSLVRTQIDVLNEDFQAIFGTPGEPGTDTKIRFKLATQDPDGNPSPGWTRTVNDFWFNDAPDPLNGTYYDSLAWDPFHYLNIYTLSPVAPGGVVLGYVPFLPQDGGVGTTEDGVRCLGTPSAARRRMRRTTRAGR
jgi:hypothetical protein